MTKFTLEEFKNRFGAPDAAKPTAPAAVEPCSDEVGKCCVALVAVLSQGKATSLLEKVLNAPYGHDRREKDLDGAINNALMTMPSGRVREIEGTMNVRWYRVSGSTRQTNILEEVLAALTSGGFVAWERLQKAAATTASQYPPPPNLEEFLSDENPWRGDQAIRAWEIAFNTWADQQSAQVLRNVKAPSVLDVEKAWRKRHAEAVAARARETVSAELSALREAVARGESLRYLQQLVHATDWGTTDLEREAKDIVRTSPQAWEAGDVDGSMPVGEPPQGWARVLPTVVVRMTAGSHADAAKQLHRVPNGTVGGWHAVLQGVLRPIWHEGHPPQGDGVYPIEPSPHGWLEPMKERDGRIFARWCGADVYAALQRVLSRPAGCMDVRRALPAYGRHPEQRYPRFSALAQTVWVTVGVADALGSTLDDLAIVAKYCPERVPSTQWRIAATVRRTKSGGLRLEAGGTERGVFALIDGNGASPNSDCSAPSVCGVGHYNAHKKVHTVTMILALIQVGCPLLLDSGIGYRVSHDGGLERVPGLAAGRPGTPQAV